MKKCTSFIYFQITLQLEVYVPEDSWKQSIICHRVTRLQNTYTDCAWLKEERSCKIKKCAAWSISAFFPLFILLWYISKSCGNAMSKSLTFILATQFRLSKKSTVFGFTGDESMSTERRELANLRSPCSSSNSFPINFNGIMILHPGRTVRF